MFASKPLAGLDPCWSEACPRKNDDAVHLANRII
jgi:hypothetical protein